MKETSDVFPIAENDIIQFGIGARDYIAIQAMTGLLAGISQARDTKNILMPTYESIAKDAYAMADAMLKESER